MPGDASDLGALAGVAIVRLTTIGRRTRRPRTVELWFAYHEGHIYLLGHPESNWVKNVSANPRVTLEMDDVTFEGAARLADSKRTQVYTLFERKYGADQVSYWYGGEGPRRPHRSPYARRAGGCGWFPARWPRPPDRSRRGHRLR